MLRPKLEHAVAAWSPWMEGDREVMEKVQRRLVRMISDKKGDTYEERLESVGLTSLVERRERGDMVEVFKSLNGFNRVDRDQWFKFRKHEESRATRSTVSVINGEENKREDVLFKESVKLDSRKHFFTVRVTDKWNELPDEIKQQKSVNSFKNRYDSWKRPKVDQQQHQSRNESDSQRQQSRAYRQQQQ